MDVRCISSPPTSPTATTKQDKLIGELIDTEYTYVTNLHHLIDIYIVPLRQNNDLYNIKHEQIKSIFMNVESIYQFHQLLYNELSDIIHQQNNVALLCKILMKYSDFMKIYTMYVNGYSTCLSTLTELSDNKKFTKYMTDVTINKLNGLSLQSMLILPVQRIPRYEMLLRELKNTIEKSMLSLTGGALHTANMHVTQLDETLDKIQSIAKYVNEKQRKFEQQSVLNTIESQLQQCPPATKQLLFHSDENQLIREFDIYKITPYMKKQRKLYVFNKYILITEKFTYKSSVTIKHIQCIPDTDNDCTLQLKHPDSKLLYLSCSASSDRTQLVSCIQKQAEICQLLPDDDCQVNNITNKFQNSSFRQSLSNLHSVSTRIDSDTLTSPPTPQSTNTQVSATEDKSITPNDHITNDIPSPAAATLTGRLPPPIPSSYIVSPQSQSTQSPNPPPIDTSAAALHHSLTHKIQSPIKMKHLSIDSNSSHISIDSATSTESQQLTRTLLPESHLAQCTHELSQISSNQLTELKHLVRPVQPVKLAIECIAILLNLSVEKRYKNDMYWKSVQSILVKPNFLSILLEFTKTRISLSNEQITLLKQYIHNPLLSVHTVSNASKPVGIVWRWIRAYYACESGNELPVDLVAHSRNGSKTLSRNNSMCNPVSTIYRAPKLSMSPSANSISMKQSPSTKSLTSTSSSNIKRPTTSIPTRMSLNSVKPIYIAHTRNSSTVSLRNATSATPANKRSSLPIKSMSNIGSVSSSIHKPASTTRITKSKQPSTIDENTKPNLSRQSSTSSNASTVSNKSTRSTRSIITQPKTNKSAELRKRISVTNKTSMPNTTTTPSSTGPKLMKAGASTKLNVLNSLSINGTGII